jgi:hypothetical protein
LRWIKKTIAWYKEGDITPMSDPVDDGLNFLEQHSPGFIKGAVHTLREGWDFVMASFPDPGVIRTQGHNLSSLHERGQKLYEEYNQSLLTLRDKWQGDLAAIYLPPAVTGFQVEHGTEPTDTSASTSLELNLRNFVDSLDHNSGTHYTWATQFDNVHGKQTEARVTISTAVLGAVAISWIPGVDVVGDGADLAGAAAIISGILAEVRQIWQDYKIIIIIVGVAGVATMTAVAVDELVRPHITTGTATQTGQQTIALSKALEKAYPDAAVRKAVSAFLACRFSHDIIQQFINMLNSSLGFASLLENAAKTTPAGTPTRTAIGAIRVLDFLAQLGSVKNAMLPVSLQEQYGVSIKNLVAVSLPVQNVGGFPDGDIDVMFKTPAGPVLHVEVGGPAKGIQAPGVFEDQLQKDRTYAASLGGDFVCVLQAVPPSDPNYAAYQTAVTRAIDTLGVGKVFIIPPPQTLPICGP